MAILVPGAGFFNRGAMWEILPLPGGSLIGSPRRGIYLNVYETITPVQITAQGILVCPGGTPGPSQPSPELIKKIRIDPGLSAPNAGAGVSVLVGSVGNIPEMQCPVFREPNVSYGMIAGLAPTLVLTPPLTGYISEKYLHDMQVGFSELYVGKEVPERRDNLRGLRRSGGYGVSRSPFKRDKVIRVQKDIPGSGTLPVSAMEIKGAQAARTVGSQSVSNTAKNSNYLFAYRPSLIRTLRFYYTITVESTCPPYIFFFKAYMDVDNNWDSHASRVKYRINRQRGAREG
jgi:hypothetical protein